MKEIIAWTAAEPVKTDFTSDKGAFILKNKINKLGVPFISEAQDNYRNHVVDAEEALLNFVQNENQKLTKMKIYNNLIDKEHMQHRTTEYREQARKTATLDNDHAKSL